MSVINATRNGETRQFSTAIWQNMPEDHYGWIQAAEVPEAVQSLIDQNALGQNPEPNKLDTPPSGQQNHPIAPIEINVPGSQTHQKSETEQDAEQAKSKTEQDAEQAKSKKGKNAGS